MAPKILLVVDANDVRRWHSSIVEELSQTDASTVTVLLRPSTAPPRRGVFGRWLGQSVPALQPAPPGVAARWRAGTDAASTACAPSACDLVLDLTTARDVTAPGPGVPVWRLIRSDGRALLDGNPFFDDAFRVAGTATVRLVETSADGGADTILDAITLGCARISYLSFLTTALALSRRMLVHRCRRFPGREAPAPDEHAAIASSIDHGAPGRAAGVPGTVAALRFVGRGLADRLWARNKDRVLMEDWTVGVLNRPISSLLSEGRVDDAVWLTLDRPGCYAADPFGMPGDDDRIVCEIYPWATGVGTLNELSISGASGRVGPELNVQCGTHMSFPSLFQDGPDLYCVPERLGTRMITIFHHDRERGEWSPLTVARNNVEAADPVLFRHDGRFWIAYTDLAIGAYDNLCLLHAPSPAGPWERHDRHPVKVDVRSARSAGTPFHHDGALYRPAQDCSATYGGAIALNRVAVCTPRDYREETVAVLNPAPSGPGRNGLHTLSAWGERTLIDGKRYVFSPTILALKAMRKLRRATRPARPQRQPTTSGVRP